MSNTKYLLDTNVLIEASKRYYAFDLVETFWQHLAHRSQDGIIKSIDKVKAEIHPENIPLSNWAVDHPSLWESTIAQDTKDKYQQLMEWADASKQDSLTDASVSRYNFHRSVKMTNPVRPTSRAHLYCAATTCDLYMAQNKMAGADITIYDLKFYIDKHINNPIARTF